MTERCHWKEAADLSGSKNFPGGVRRVSCWASEANQSGGTP